MLCGIGDTDEEGLTVGAKTLWFLNTSLKQAPQMSKFLPGRNPPQMAPNIWRTTGVRGRPADGLIGISAETAIQRGILVAGNPDTVARQIMEIYDKVDGFAHLIFIGRLGVPHPPGSQEDHPVDGERSAAAFAGGDHHSRGRAAGRRIARTMR